MTWLQHILLKFCRAARDDSGAVTVDWVVLTAAVVGLTIALFTTIGSESQDHGNRIATVMSSYSIPTY
ncbi:MAG: hypothetical protein QNJ44_20355 [Rhodobacter sp.]|nr:hypothetical protein [Rhodobacter sp.]